MDKVQLATLNLIFSTIHLLNATYESMIKLEHQSYAAQCKAMVRSLTKDIDKVVKKGGKP